MSIESSEIVTSLTTAFRQGLVDLHNQIINDVQGIVGQSELRQRQHMERLESRIAELERALQQRDGGA